MTYQSKSTAYKAPPDSGTLRAATIKKGQNSPDYWGEISINLKDMTNIRTEDGLTIVKLSGWKKVGKDGKTYLSLSVNRYVPKQESGGYTRQPTRQEDDFGDDSNIPF